MAKLGLSSHLHVWKESKINETNQNSDTFGFFLTSLTQCQTDQTYFLLDIFLAVNSTAIDTYDLA